MDFTRTNNHCEVFHKNLNAKVERTFPRLSYLASSLAEITKEAFVDIIRNLSSPKKTKASEINIYKKYIGNILAEMKEFMDYGGMVKIIPIENGSNEKGFIDEVIST